MAEWFPTDLIKATCSVNVYYFLFDMQECHKETYDRAYTGFEVKLVPLYNTIYTEMMSGHGSWSVIETKAKAELDGFVY